MELNILLRLLTGHIIGDFVLQPASWVDSKETKGINSRYLYFHVAVVTALTYAILAEWLNWCIPAIVFTTHLAIDIWKTTRPKTFNYFVVDQLLHLLIILGIWCVFYLNPDNLSLFLKHTSSNNKFWILGLAYLFVTGPLGIIIGKATEKWRKAASMDTDGLEKAGIWIGRCERILVLTFIITAQYTALGFLMASKSILRFAEKEPFAQKKTEYILVGTLISFASAAVIGVIASILIKS